MYGHRVEQEIVEIKTESLYDSKHETIIMKFNIIIEKDEDGRYVAECTDLPGCLSEGENLEDALENISEAIIGCLKSRLKSAGEKINTATFENRLNISIDLQGNSHVQASTS